MTQLQMIDKTKSIAQNDKNISAVFMLCVIYGLHMPLALASLQNRVFGR